MMRLSEVAARMLPEEKRNRNRESDRVGEARRRRQIATGTDVQIGKERVLFDQCAGCARAALLRFYQAQFGSRREGRRFDRIERWQAAGHAE